MCSLDLNPNRFATTNLQQIVKIWQLPRSEDAWQVPTVCVETCSCICCRKQSSLASAWTLCSASACPAYCWRRRARPWYGGERCRCSAVRLESTARARLADTPDWLTDSTEGRKKERQPQPASSWRSLSGECWSNVSRGGRSKSPKTGRHLASKLLWYTSVKTAEDLGYRSAREKLGDRNNRCYAVTSNSITDRIVLSIWQSWTLV